MTGLKEWWSKSKKRQWKNDRLYGRWKQFPHGTSSHCLPDMASLSLSRAVNHCKSLYFFGFSVSPYGLRQEVLSISGKTLQSLSISFAEHTNIHALSSRFHRWASTCLSVRHKLHKSCVAFHSCTHTLTLGDNATSPSHSMAHKSSLLWQKPTCSHTADKQRVCSSICQFYKTLVEVYILHRA